MYVSFGQQGYFRRAEALKAMLSAPKQYQSLPGSFQEVVKDYVKTHTLEPNVEALCQAIILAISHGKDCHCTV